MSNRFALIVLTLALALGTAGPAAAQNTIGTDRPGLGFNPALVAPGTVQFELGVPAVGLTSDGNTDVRAFSFPTALRVGLADRLEFRLGSAMYQNTRVDAAGRETTTDGFGDLESSLKVGVWSGRNGGPSVALIPAITLPTGADEVSSNEPGYSVNTTAGWALGSAGLTTVAGISADPTGADTYQTQGAFVAVLGHGLTSSLSGYVEAGVYPTEAAENPAYTGAGLALLASPDVQLDAFVLRGLTDASTDWQFGVGLSARLMP